MGGNTQSFLFSVITTNLFFMCSLTLESALADLHSPEKEVRARASATLITIGTAAIPALLGLLHDKDWVIRYRAVEALGGIGDTAAVEPLMQCTTDEKDHVRYMAAKSLARMEDPRIVPVLIRMLSDDHSYTRRIAAEGLSRLGNADALPHLESALLHETDPDVKQAIARALSSNKNK